MDFFQHQDIARRKTSLLIVYFVLAVILIILAVYGVFSAIFIWNAAQAAKAKSALPPQPLPPLWNPDMFLWVTIITLAVVILGTLFKIIALSEGGESVARMLGARPIDVNTANHEERRLLNVVEEVAIASGTPVPRVFMLEDENNINAFAAGFSTTDAVIGVTRGCLKQLSRDELQGVIAHEFSHILNGDMRLNIRLMGVLNGILVLGIIGYWIFWSAIRTSPSRSIGSGRRRGGNPLPFILLGLGVMAIGYIGVFFGKLIKSAVSRQREFLADAASVQFTRNPAGIAGALKRIAGIGSRVNHPGAEEASHLFFANGLKQSFVNLMATHPPILERIRRVDSSFDGTIAARKQEAESHVSRQQFFAEPTGAQQRVASIAVQPEQVIQSVGNPQPEHLAYVSGLLSSIPDQIKDTVREPFGARALIYCLLLNQDPEPRERQIQHLAQHSEPATYKETLKLIDSIKTLKPEARLPLVDMALATLRSLSKKQFIAFKTNLGYLVEADEKITLFEYMLQRMVIRHLETGFNGRKPRVIQYYDINPMIPHAVVILSTLAYYGCSDDNEAARAFETGMNRLHKDQMPTILPRAQCGLQEVDKALNVLSTASPQIKKKILDACSACIIADGWTTVDETELLRAIADSLECPIPPILP